MEHPSVDAEGTGCTSYEAQPTGIVGIVGSREAPSQARGRVFEGSGPTSKGKYIMNTSDFSVKPFTFIFYNGQRFHWQAIAVNGLIAWELGKDDSRAPVFWGKREDLQDMINGRDERLLALLKSDVVKDEITVCGREFELKDI